MFDKDASALTRFDWPGVGTQYLQGDPESWTNEDMGRAVEGLRVGINMLSQELLTLLQHPSVPLKHTNLTLQDARTGEDHAVNPMSTATSMSAINAPLHVSHPTAYVTDDGQVRGAAIVAEGPIVALPAPDIKAKFGDQINQVGFIGLAAKFGKLFVDDICVNRIGNAVCGNFFQAAYFQGDNSASSASAIGTQSVGIDMTRQLFMGSDISTAATLQSGTYLAMGKMTVRRAASASTVHHVEGRLLLAGTPIDYAKITPPATSHGQGTSAAFVSMFSTAGNQALSLDAKQPDPNQDIINSTYRFDQEQTSFVVVRVPD